MPVSVRTAFSVVSLCVTLAFPGMRELVRCLVVVLDFRCTESLNRIKPFFCKSFLSVAQFDACAKKSDFSLCTASPAPLKQNRPDFV